MKFGKIFLKPLSQIDILRYVFAVFVVLVQKLTFMEHFFVF